MKKTGTLRRTLSALCALMMMISLFVVPAFADEAQENAEKTGLSTAAIIWIVIGGVILVAAIVLGIKFREQIGKTLVVYKSEFKKVSWLSWKDTKKSSWIVLGVLVACAIVICLLDLGLFEGFMAMINAFGKLFAA